MSKKRKKHSIETFPNLPEGFVVQMGSLIGEEEAGRLVAALEEPASVSIRLNRKKVKDPETFIKRFEDYGLSPVEWCDSGYYLEKRPDFVHDPLFHAGTYYVQEAASMIYETIVRSQFATPANHPLRVLDLCAAPGGKSTAILNALEGDYVLVANEFDSKRVRILKENLNKWGDPNVIVTNSPTSKFSKLENYFDIVAVDAPCSGEGMMRREAIARSQWSEGLVRQCSALQREILSDAIATLNEGGLLIYSTCTFNREENEENVEWLENVFGLTPVMEPRHFYPHRERCEGLFVAAFRKPGMPSHNSCKPLELLKKACVRIISSGTEKTVSKGNIELPSSRSVLAYDYDRNSFPLVNLNIKEALSYLRRNAVTLPPDTPKGFVAVAFEDNPLGLVKNLGTRSNNLYPPEWRVLT